MSSAEELGLTAGEEERAKRERPAWGVTDGAEIAEEAGWWNREGGAEAEGCVEAARERKAGRQTR